MSGELTHHVWVITGQMSHMFVERVPPESDLLLLKRVGVKHTLDLVPRLAQVEFIFVEFYLFNLYFIV